MVISDKKVNYFDRLLNLLKSHEQILIVGADNVASLQMQQIRQALRGKGIVLMGKNTMVRKAIKSNLDKIPQAARLLPFIKGNIGFIFVEKGSSIAEVRKVVTSNRRAAPARAGAISPVDVIVPAGNTGMEPTKTSFFQALNIPTKITKGTVEIVSDQKILSVGDRVGNSEAQLLQMLKIMPFTYGLEVQVVYESGFMYSPEVFDLTDEDYKGFFKTAATRMAAVAMATGYATELVVPFAIQQGFKNIASISLAIDYDVKELKGLKQMLENPQAAVAAAPAASTTNAAAPAAAPAKEEEEEEEDIGLSLFD